MAVTKKITNKTAKQYMAHIADLMTKGRNHLWVTYKGQAGAIRMAREVGYALNDFPEDQHLEGKEGAWLVAKKFYSPDAPPIDKKAYLYVVDGVINR
jgi:hypothetical protein